MRYVVRNLGNWEYGVVDTEAPASVIGNQEYGHVLLTTRNGSEVAQIAADALNESLRKLKPVLPDPGEGYELVPLKHRETRLQREWSYWESNKWTPTLCAGDTWESDISRYPRHYRRPIAKEHSAKTGREVLNAILDLTEHLRSGGV